MKRRIYNSLVLILVLLILNAGCGGGGGSAINPGPQPTSPIDTPTTNPVFTPTNTPGTGNTPTPTSTLPPGVTPTNTPVGNTPTPTSTPNSSKNITVNVKDLFDLSNKSGLQIYFNDAPVTTTDASGNASFSITANGRLKLTGNNVERSMPIYTFTDNYQISTLPASYNTTFLRGLFGNVAIRKWANKPTFVLYKYRLDSDPNSPVAVPQATLDNIKSAIQNDLSTLANGFFTGVIIEEYNGHPKKDPRFSMVDTSFGAIRNTGYYSIAVVLDVVGGSGSTMNGSSGNTIQYAGTVVEESATLSTIRHELGHGCFFWEHPFDFIALASNENSIMNYASTGKRTDVYSPKDIEVSKFWASRPGGNNTPDYDPDGSTAKTSEKLVETKFKIH